MALEDAVNRLANAIGMHDDMAVKEIIRQRDAAEKKLEIIEKRAKLAAQEGGAK